MEITEAQLRALADKWQADESQNHVNTMGFRRGLLHCARELNALLSAAVVSPPSLALRLLPELRAYLDTLTITGENIGNIRRQCFVPWSSEWNGIVRDETAEREKASAPDKTEP